jgi:hypothetical protein
MAAGTSADGVQLREAWDTGAYFLLGVPLMALAVTAASFVAPSRAWRWPLWMAGGHQAGVLAAGAGMQSGLSLALLTVIVVVMLATVLAIPAEVGSRLNRYVLARAY